MADQTIYECLPPTDARFVAVQERKLKFDGIFVSALGANFPLIHDKALVERHVVLVMEVECLRIGNAIRSMHFMVYDATTGKDILGPYNNPTIGHVHRTKKSKKNITNTLGPVL